MSGASCHHYLFRLHSPVFHNNLPGDNLSVCRRRLHLTGWYWQCAHFCAFLISSASKSLAFSAASGMTVRPGFGWDALSTADCTHIAYPEVTMLANALLSRQVSKTIGICCDAMLKQVYSRSCMREMLKLKSSLAQTAAQQAFVYLSSQTCIPVL